MWIHKNSTDTSRQSKYFILLLHTCNIDNEMSTSNIKFLTQHVNTTYKHDYKSKYIPIVINIINAMTKSNIKFIPIQNKSVIVNMCVLFYLSFGCISAYANVYFQPTIIKQNIKIILLQNNIHMSGSIAGVPFDSVGRFRATLLLRTTCMRLWGNWAARCVAA